MSENKNKINSLKLPQIALLTAVAIFGVTLSAERIFASEINSNNVYYLINQERMSRGLPKLNLDPELSQAAGLKSKDMLNRNYFEHYAFGLSPWDFIKLSGYNYLYAGENLAMDFNTSEGMVKAWMNSPTHRDNILNPDYTDTGVGVIKGEYNENGSMKSTVIVSNMFGRKKPAIVKVFDYITRNFFGSF